jgi:putative membrane protein
MRALLVVIILGLLALPGGVAASHSGGPLEPHDLWTAWNWDPIILTTIVLTSWLYFRGIWLLWRQAGHGRGVQRWQIAAFTGGLFALILALISPIDALGEVLFSGHMLQHLLLILVAAPLLVLGVPPAAVAWAIPERWRAGLGRWWRGQYLLRNFWQLLNKPVLVWVLHALALLAWHVPVLYEAAIEYEFFHFLEHTSFLLTALLYWMVLVQSGRKGHLSYGAGMLYVFSMAMFSGVLGALITFSRQAWYPIHAETALLWGFTPLEDQQLAGVLMWVPGNFIYLLAFLILLWRWFAEMDKRDKASLPEREAAS